jgi:HD-GYP domain-containing protein (c-di-GMP phosphodiesterase class II)
MRRGVLLHDIGKLGIPDQVLKKKGHLSEADWIELKKHPQYAYDLIYPITYLRPALDIPYNHHEHWDGSGYPRGLKMEQIPLAARIFAIVDVYDALSSDRAYRPAWPREKVLDYLRQQSGKQFDPNIVEVFLHLLNQ